jgi:cytochrome c-type biogenesis protein CcmH/NrfG
MKLASDVDQRGDHGTAATLYLRATQEPGAGVEAWNRLGELKLASGDAIAAESAFQQALALAPDKPQSQLGLGTAQLRLGYPERAQPLLASAAPRLNSVIAYTRLGVAEALLGQTSSAQDAFSSAMALAPNDLDSRCNLALAYVLNNQPGPALDEISGADKAPAVQPRHQRNVLLVHVLAGSQGNPAKVRLDGVDVHQRQALINDAKRIAAIKDPAAKAQALGLVDRH